MQYYIKGNIDEFDIEEEIEEITNDASINSGTEDEVEEAEDYEWDGEDETEQENTEKAKEAKLPPITAPV